MLDRYADAASSALGEVAATQGQAVEEAAHLVAASQNLDGPSVADHDAALMARYADRAGEGAP